MTKNLGLHETLEAHEILTFKSLCLTKSSTMSSLVQDTELQNILLKDSRTGTQDIQILQEILTNRGEQQ
ncbi:hypothetical protein [Peribacillus sp. Bi134]|uniref:hypothetical protein n=1 Tax=Peribacillus sp. Bi134 TaxID=2884272 RepID=UPI001D77BB04|nr:hypothetical protein [Peribacillus sp. Bi134]CAH0127093.1 hypothetical protein SRABI134_00165 [Peribacillus sp. Bi134]